MIYLCLVLTTISVSIDGFCSGFALGLRKIIIRPMALLIISIIPIICTFIAMQLGAAAQSFIPPHVGGYIGAALLVILAFLTYKEMRNKKKGKVHAHSPTYCFADPSVADSDHEQDIKASEGVLLGFAVALDASTVAFTLGLQGVNPYIWPIMFGLSHFVLIGLGNLLSNFKPLSKLTEAFYYLPVFLFLILAGIRLI